MLDFLQTLLANSNQNNTPYPFSNSLPGASGQLPPYLMNPLMAGAGANAAGAASPNASSQPAPAADNNAILSNLRQQILMQSMAQNQGQAPNNASGMPGLGSGAPSLPNRMASPMMRPALPMMMAQGNQGQPLPIPASIMPSPLLRRPLGAGSY